MIIDLSVPINQQTPVYPGDPAVKITAAGVLERDGYCDHLVAFGTHVGTHIDAPAHMIKGGKTLNQISLNQFVGTGKYIKVDDIFDLDTIKNNGIKAGDIVLFDTGMAAKYHDKVYFENFPVMTEEVANYLVECKVKMVGVDTGSVDNKDGFPIHKILLSGDVLIIENLTNLQQLKGKDFKVYALPLNLEIDGAPARVIAEIN
jgi:arylformamidase